MRALLLALEVGGEMRRYTTAPEPQDITTADGTDTYQPGLELGSVPCFTLTQVVATITDPSMDWPAILLGYSGPPVWPAELAWTSGDGVAHVVQVGLATVDAAGRPAQAITISIDSSQVPGVQLVPDPSIAVQPDSYPVSLAGPTATIWARHDPAVGSVPPLIYGMPGVDGKGLYSGEGIPGPATPAYLVELGQGALDQGYGTLEIAATAIVATKAKVFDVSAGYRRTGWMEMPVNVEYKLDALGRPRTVCVLDGVVVGDGLLATPDSEYWCAFYGAHCGGVLDPVTGSTMRDASRVLPDLLGMGGYPVDQGRSMSLQGLLLDFSINEPVSAVEWITQHMGALPVHVFRGGGGFFVEMEPLDSDAAGLVVRLGSEAALADELSWAEPSSIPASVVLSYAPVKGATGRQVYLSATGAEPGARASVLCAMAAGRGLSAVADVSMPAVYDVATAERMADLVALDRCTAGPYGTITTGDEGIILAALAHGPHLILELDETDSPEPVGLTGRRCYVQSMTISQAGLTMQVRLLREVVT